MPISLSQLLSQVSPQTEARVKKARDATRGLIQEILRSECRLQLRTEQSNRKGEPAVQVPVEVVPGLPAVLENVTFPDNLALCLILSRYRVSLEQAEQGLAGLQGLIQELQRAPQWAGLVRSGEPAARETEQLVKSLLDLLNKEDPLKHLLGVEEDVLGAYIYQLHGLFLDDHPNAARIELYWAVIGLTAQWLAATPEDLTVLVLAHELAHAYTQLGADIDGRRWPVSAFAGTEKHVKEGLAQYYTERVLDRRQDKCPGAWKAYVDLLPRQPDAYRAHKPWIDDHTPEAVRLAMLEFRRSKQTKLADFQSRLTAAQVALGK
ncbi:MAG: hypothetical protein HYY24_02965 [Verrucomicrobia bacterium]|nr:hypothetical protein [Verrucomicrobiota bacterium]